MQTNNPKLIESATRLSQSKIWEIEENYFTQTGIDVFKTEVPFYISSNALIGQHYAQLIYNFIQDEQRQHPAQKGPFYILEVGAGTGKFSFYFLKAFAALVQNSQPFDFIYILSDVSEKNISFCQQNPSLKSYIDNKQLDFAQFNVAKDTDLHLKIAQKNLSELKTDTPLIVIANYTFDCIYQDAFVFEDSKLKEAQLEIQCRYKDFNIEKSRHLMDLRLKFEYALIQHQHYYENEAIDAILHHYTKTDNSNARFIMIPLGAFDLVEHLRKINPRVFMMVGDKGVAKPEQFAFIKEKEKISYDGCFSFLFNFHALGEYTKYLKGDCCLTNNSNDFKVSLYSVGFTFNDYYLTKNFFYNIFENFGPHEYCFIYDEYLNYSYRFNIKSLIAFLRISQYDPLAYAAIHDRLMALIPIFDALILDEIQEILEKVIENVYHLPVDENVLNYIGCFYVKIKNQEKALDLFKRSIEVFPQSSIPHRNVAIIYEQQNKVSKALEYYEKAFALNKRDGFAERKIHQLTGRFYSKGMIPIIKAIGIFALIVVGIYLYTKYIIRS